MIRLYALGAALLGCLALIGAVYWQAQRLDAAKSRISTLDRSIAAVTMTAEHNAIAKDVARAAEARQASIAAKARGDVEAILTGDFGECINAELPDDLRAILDGVRSDD